MFEHKKKKIKRKLIYLHYSYSAVDCKRLYVETTFFSHLCHNKWLVKYNDGCHFIFYAFQKWYLVAGMCNGWIDVGERSHCILLLILWSSDGKLFFFLWNFENWKKMRDWDWFDPLNIETVEHFGGMTLHCLIGENEWWWDVELMLGEWWWYHKRFNSLAAHRSGERCDIIAGCLQHEKYIFAILF